VVASDAINFLHFRSIILFVNSPYSPYTRISMVIRDFFLFWYVVAPKEIFLYFLSLNKAYFQLLSFGLLLTTFFKPLKNEYRKGLVGFSIGMGIFIKLAILFVTLVIFIPFIMVQLILFSLFLVLPFVPFYLLLS
jgi:hypothetical protein